MKKQWITKLVSVCMAMVLMVSLLVGCGNNGETSSEAQKTIKWYLATQESADINEVEAAANARLAELGSDLKIEFVCVSMGNYDQKLQLANAGKEEYDLCFTSNWCNNIYQNVSNGSLADITDLVPKYAPKLYASMDEKVWDAVKINGKLYAVPNWQIQAKSLGCYMPASKLEKVGMEPSDFKTIEDVTEYLKRLSKVETQKGVITASWDVVNMYYGLVPVGSLMLPGMIRYKSDEKITVINQYESPEFREYVSTVRSWVENGYITDDYLKADEYSAKGIERKPLHFGTYSPGVERDLSVEYEWKGGKLGDAVLNTDGITAAMVGVSATSASPENAVKMLEFVNTDKELMNIICYGLEGKHYEKIGENTIRYTDVATYSRPSAFTVASSENLYVKEGKPENVWEETRAFNESAIESPILGFTVDMEPISVELANCQTVINEQIEMLTLGLVPVDEGIEKLVKSLKEAGSDKIIEEYQRQLDNWLANKK